MRIVTSFVFILALAFSCTYSNEEELFGDSNCPTNNLTYAKDIRPIVEGNGCVGCHNSGSESGGVNLDGYDNLKNYPDRLYGAINHDANYAAMPPSGIKIDSCQIAQVKAWIDQGMTKE
ncbi:MAG: cytochrome c [Bacteroidia bacterium]